jgi:outer membrane protein assembly factor BamB
VPGPNPGTDSLIALRLDDGAIVWSDQIHPGDTDGFDFNSAPVILGRVLVAASKDGFHAWDRMSRRRLWHRQLTPALSKHQSVAGPTNGPEGGPVATDGRRVYVLSNDAAHNSCVAAALAPATGRVLWHRRLSSFSFAAPAVAGDRLFVTGADGTLRGLATSTGKLVAAVPEHGSTSRRRGPTRRRRRRRAVPSGTPARLHRRTPVADGKLEVETPRRR